MKTTKNRKPNKSSIVKVIVSDFDKFGIKELKVIYRKNKGIDILEIDNEKEFKKLEFRTRVKKNGDLEEFATSKLNVLRVYDSLDNTTYEVDTENIVGKTRVIVKNLDDGSLSLEKIVEDRPIKKYTIKIEYIRTKNHDLQMRVKISDRLFYKLKTRKILEKKYGDIRLEKLNYNLYCNRILELERPKKRRKTGRAFSYTERILLDNQVNDYYERISGIKNVSSREIIWINKFVDYRSNMLLYYKVINNLMVKDLKVASSEFEEHNGKDLDILDVEEGINWNRDYSIFMNKVFKDKGLNIEVCTFIEGHNENIDRQIDNLDIEDKTYLESKRKLEERYIGIEEINTREDFRKIYKIVSFLKREMFSYNYETFRQIYSGEEVFIGEEDLKDLLNLDIFKIMDKVNLVKTNIKTNYLSEKTRIFVLGENIKAKKILSRYINISERVEGFNDFVNYNIDKYLGENGLALEEYSKYFFKTIDILENSHKPNEFLLKDYKNLKKWIGAPFIDDIQLSKEYKNLYNARKNLMENVDKSIENEEILKLNRKMKNITNLNSKYRLQIKMQFAFAYIKRFWDENKASLKDDENVNSLVDSMNEYGQWNTRRVSKEEFLEILKLKDRDRMITKIIEKYQFRNSEDLFNVSNESNLLKIYILIYSLLPMEIKSEFLRFVKKNMYDIKLVDTPNNIKRKNKFFSNLKLFERNTSKLQLLSYSVTDVFIEPSSLVQINKFIENYFTDNVGDIRDNDLIYRLESRNNNYIKSFIVPVFEYYKIVYKLLNDIELELLYKRAEKDESSINTILSKYKRELEFEKIIQDIDIIKLDRLGYLKANILSMRDEKLLLEVLNIKDELSVAGRLEEKMTEFQVKDILRDSLNKNVINDYYMKKEQLVFEYRSFIEEKYRLKVRCVNKKQDESYTVRELLEKIELKEKQLEKITKLKKFKQVKYLESEMEKLLLDLDKKIKKLGIKLALQTITKDEIKTLKIERVYEENLDAKEIETFYFRYNKTNNKYEDIYNHSAYVSNGSIITIDEERDEKFPVQTIDLSNKYRHKISFKIK